MNILSQKETNCTCGGGMFDKIAKQAQEKVQKAANEIIDEVTKQIKEGVNNSLKIV